MVEEQPKEKKKMGRKLKEVSAKVVREMAAIGCTNIEIANACGVSDDTLFRRFGEELKEARADLHERLRKAQIKSALKKENVDMQKWLGKQYLDQKDKTDITSKDEKVSVGIVYEK